MTHDIVQSDIDLAKRLIKSGRPDADVLESLVQRGIALAKAAELLQDLRSGRPVSVQTSFGAETELEPEPDETNTGSPPTQEAVAPLEESTRRSRGYHHVGLSKRSIRRRRIAGLAICFGIAGVVFAVFIQNYHAKTNSLLDELEGAVSALSRAVPTVTNQADMFNFGPGSATRASDDVRRCQELRAQLEKRKLSRKENRRLNAVVSELGDSAPKVPVGPGGAQPGR